MFIRKTSFTTLLLAISLPALFFTQLACNPSSGGAGNVAQNGNTTVVSGITDTTDVTGGENESGTQAAPNMPGGVLSPSSDPTINIWPQLICYNSSQFNTLIQNPLGSEDEQSSSKIKTHFWVQLGHMKASEWIECSDEACGNFLIRIVNWNTGSQAQYVQVKPQYLNGKHSTFEASLMSDTPYPKVTFYGLKNTAQSIYTPSDLPQNCTTMKCSNDDWKLMEAKNDSCDFLNIYTPLDIIKF